MYIAIDGIGLSKTANMFFSIFLMVQLLGNLCLASDMDDTILKKLHAMENRLLEQENRLVEQESRLLDQERINAKQQQVIDQQHITIQDQQHLINQLEAKCNNQNDNTANFEDRIANVSGSNRSNDFDEDIISNPTQKKQRINRAIHSHRSLSVRQYPERVAFTAYLDHALSHFGMDRPIIYNKVLLNEAIAYDPNTGIFTSPINGLYGFNFSISSFGVHQDAAKLVVDGVNQINAIAETFHDNHNIQGANFAVLSLRQDQKVWVASYFVSGQVIYSTDRDRFASFSGFVLY